MQVISHGAEVPMHVHLVVNLLREWCGRYYGEAVVQNVLADFGMGEEQLDEQGTRIDSHCKCILGVGGGDEFVAHFYEPGAFEA